VLLYYYYFLQSTPSIFLFFSGKGLGRLEGPRLLEEGRLLQFVHAAEACSVVRGPFQVGQRKHVESYLHDGPFCNTGVDIMIKSQFLQLFGEKIAFFLKNQC
jgi:hypothetical protein